jgi:hypothetical protein
MERIMCTFKPLVNESGGRAVCAPQHDKGYKQKDNCAKCPKVNKGVMGLPSNTNEPLYVYTPKPRFER